MPTIPPNSLVVVTGITGYIGSHVGVAALQAGLRVRGTVRTPEKAKELPEALKRQGIDTSNLEVVVLDDLSSKSQYASAIKEASGVVHVALDGRGVADLTKAATDANIALFEAAAKEPSVKRIVLTSSLVAATLPGTFQEKMLDENDWNEVAVKKFVALAESDQADPGNDLVRYSTAKTLAEKAAWAWMKEHKPAFELVSILPCANFGPVIFGPPHSTAGWIHQLLQNDGGPAKNVPPQWFVDVRDDARLHVLGLTQEPLGGKRIWAVAQPYGWNQILDVLRQNFPGVSLPEDVPGKQGAVDPQQIDNKVATDALSDWITLEKSIVDTAKGFGF